MSDLISRKVLQREIEYLYDLNYGETLIDPREFYDMVDCQLDAYDVDKVVERLEKITDGYKTQYHMGCYATEDDVKNAIKRAVKIVKGGGQA